MKDFELCQMGRTDLIGMGNVVGWHFLDVRVYIFRLCCLVLFQRFVYTGPDRTTAIQGSFSYEVRLLLGPLTDAGC